MHQYQPGHACGQGENAERSALLREKYTTVYLACQVFFEKFPKKFAFGKGKDKSRHFTQKNTKKRGEISPYE